ncbi:hypothetical protein AWB76_04824 [Caballeronia temeraria]|uniref:DUF2934 domain-containing protein n=1 Tax=Caballeronia temeraria TaxID=1777137 RepID=A0A158BY23_9BURK|nr:DUF2934 domain-containing protein [Caballeronia temeraria]SAK74891.1 hypothetical protein AWB76_04824 [Caballeronia temeraria]
MDTPLSADEIRVRAYLLWEAEGCQGGRDEHYWLEAIAQLGRERVEGPDGTGVDSVAVSDAPQLKAGKKVGTKKVGQEAPARVGKKSDSATNGRQQTAKTPKAAAEGQKKADTKSEAKSESNADVKVKAQAKAKAGAKSTTQQKADATAAAPKPPKRSKRIKADAGQEQAS